VFQLAADPTHAGAPPPALDPVPYIALAPLENAVAHLKKSAKSYDSAFAKAAAGLPPDRAQRLQALMQTIDQSLVADAGLPFRPWYKNLIYAPGRFTGYGAKTLPGVREAIEERRWDDADRYAVLTAAALDAYAKRLDQATAILDGR
jgi:N-acetylated-alpha-linked acidic dipeptidase